MPTAARLFAALAFAAVGALAAEAYRAALPPHAVWGNASAVAAAMGAGVGWSVMGPRAGRGYGAGLAVGLSTAVVLVLAVSFVFAVREMVLRALARRYDGVLEAVVGIFGIMLEHAGRMGDLRFLATLALGGLAGGLIAEAAARRWR